MDPRDTISVIVYAYNHERFIGECLDSLLAQTRLPDEIVVCDDASTDATGDIVARYAAAHAIIRHARHPANIGMHRNANFGLRQATGDLVTSLGGDDRWLPRKLEREAEALARHPSAGAAYSGVVVIDEEGNPTGDVWAHPGAAAGEPEDLLVRVFAKRLFPGTSSVLRNQLVRRRVAEAVGPYDESIAIYLDWDYKIRLAAAAPIVYTGEILVEYRDHAGGVHNSPTRVLGDSLVQVYRKNDPLLDTRPPAEAAFARCATEGVIALEYLPGEPPEGYSVEEVLDRWRRRLRPLDRPARARVNRELRALRAALLRRATRRALGRRQPVRAVRSGMALLGEEIRGALGRARRDAAP